ncbi:MBL fold metallo-hydrolase [Pontibacter sp. E15-1]|uniref:MBL fold metallo-hydrolase n=1 Tax=Pontibacter sp. E15-1 TaxID=2919918 RepID=UPI001F4FB6BC|nr:MBL fold metallo-hydrolase [Pontibacter sp. E15-1]MCJ8163367.1 MBL fold metallo-hydrolase [Pontibacter sp. E15-1]
MNAIFSMILILIGSILSLSVGYLYLNPQFGGRISAEEKERYTRSAQWDGDKFVNQTTTVMDISLGTLPGLLKANFTDKEKRAPKQALPLERFDSLAWVNDTSATRFIWFGHSTGLMQMAGKNLLIDPMFGADASPIAPFQTKRYSDSTLFILDRLPAIDAVFITHDHYDHLDYDSFRKLNGKVGHFYVPLGVKRHLLRWGIASDKITELDWWDAASVAGIDVTFVPSRHFSGRGLSDRGESLWGGWVFSTAASRVYWSGDSGYGEHFKEIGARLGPFDWAFLECGQYNKHWHHIHMYPEESVQAAIDVKAKTSIPIHWGAFTLSLHDWKDPVQRFSAEAERRGVPIMMPRLGEVIQAPDTTGQTYWWQQHE